MVTNIYVFIIAGGFGVRLSPLSTVERPKQFIGFVDGKSLIRQAFERALKLTDKDKIFVATNVQHVGLVSQHLPELPLENIISEVCLKNTAPAIAFAAYRIFGLDPNSTMVCMPSDHLITDEDNYVDILKYAGECLLEHDHLVTLGVEPKFPSTEFGYIKRCPKQLKARFYPVERFVEKPNSKKAQEYLESGQYYWNSGTFIWRAKTIMDAFVSYCPSISANHLELPIKGARSEQVDKYFCDCEKISIDYAVMERANNIAVIPAHVNWSDIGSWDAISRLMVRSDIRLSDEVTSAYLERAHNETYSK